jgi:hypothetical protein
MLATIGLALAGFFGLCTVIVIGCSPIWIANAQDGDLAELGILETSA